MGDSSTHYVAITFSPRPSIAYFLKGVLDCAGFTVTATSSRPDDVVSVVERSRPDVIVYDISQPIAEARRSLARLRRRPLLRGIPVVLVTSDARACDGAAGVRVAVALCGQLDEVKQLREAVSHAVTRGRSRPAA